MFKSKEQKGRLPEGFSERYNRTIPSGLVLHETPFKAYLDKIWHSVDALHDKTGISDWLYLDESVEINAAAQAISDWAKRHREMNALLREKSYVGNTTIMVPVSNYCTVLSDCKLYDLIEQKKKEITYMTYPNYHDDTYADWSFK